MIDLVFTEPEFGTDPPVKKIIQDEGINIDPDSVSVIIRKGKVTVRIYDTTLTEADMSSLEDAIEAAYDDTQRLGREEHAKMRGFEKSQREKSRMPDSVGNSN